jgi:hypothetical protein
MSKELDKPDKYVETVYLVDDGRKWYNETDGQACCTQEYRANMQVISLNYSTSLNQEHISRF